MTQKRLTWHCGKCRQLFKLGVPRRLRIRTTCPRCNRYAWCYLFERRPISGEVGG